MRPQVHQTTDPDAVEDLVSRQYFAMRMRISGPRALVRLATTSLGRASMNRNFFGLDLEGSAQPVEQVFVLRVLSGTARYASAGVEQRFGAGETGSPLEARRDWTVDLSHMDSTLLALDQSLVDDTAGVVPGNDAHVRLISNRPHTPAAGRRLWRVADAVRLGVADEAAPYPLVLDAASRLLAAATLAAFPHTAAHGASIEDRHDAHPDTVRRAIAYIEANPHREVGLADIAAAAHVTPRAVQLAFRRHLGTTPVRYLRRTRLHHAHHDLVAADPHEDTVTAIAMRWGFGNPSRFAGYYRDEYGVLPSQTLRADH